MPPGLPRSSFVSAGSIHIDVPNLVMIGPAVWPPIVARQTHTHRNCIALPVGIVALPVGFAALWLVSRVLRLVSRLLWLVS